jgi:transcription elongation factor SPT5
MRKFFDKTDPAEKLMIKSAIAPSHLKGFVYIEAEKESHVKQAIKGVRTLQEYSLRLVPIKEMADVLTVTKKANTFHKGGNVLGMC